MSDIFVNSGENGDVTAGPSPQLQGLFIPGIDNPLAQDGFGIVTPWGGGSTTRRYGEYGIAGDISRQTTQLSDLASSLVPAGGGEISFGLEGPQGIQGIPGRDGLPGIITILGLNSNFLTELPHNLDLINDLGTAVNKLIYTSAYTTYRNFVWNNTTIASISSWNDSDINTDASFLIIVADAGIYISTDDGDSWEVDNPDADTYIQAICAASGGKAIVLGNTERENGTIWTTDDYGVNWTEKTVGSGDTPIGADLTSGTTNGNTLATYGDWTDREITLDSSIELTSGVKYAIIVKAPDVVGDAELYWSTRVDNPYANGDRYGSSDSGSSWTIDTDDDVWFKTKASGVEKDDGSFTQDGFNRAESVYGTNWSAQTFMASSTYTISSVVLRLAQYLDWGGSVETVTVSIRAVGGINVRKIWLGSEGNFLIAVTETGVYLSVDFGDNWTRKTPDAVEDTDWIKGICSSDGTYIIVVSSANAIYRSANSGTSWAQITPAGGDTFSVNKLATSDDGQYMVIVGQNSTDPTESCYISADYGATWTAKKPVDASIEWTDCDISNDGVIIAVSTSDYFYISFDSGEEWLEQGMASSAEVWTGLSISGDGVTGLVANINDNDEFFIGTNTELYSEATWAETALTSAGRALLDDPTAAAQATTLGLGIGNSPTFVNTTLTGLTVSSLVAANASKLLESVTIGTGLNYTSPTLSFSHLGIEALTDPSADRIMFWDNSASASKWLGVGDSIVITGVTIDTIQDIRTSASPAFAGFTKIGDASNYMTVATNGLLTMVGTARVWDCVDLDPTAINNPGGGPGTNPANDNIDDFRMHRYDDTVEEEVWFLWHVPSDYAEGTANVRGHFDFVVDGGGGGGDTVVRMGYDWLKLSPGDVFSWAGAGPGFMDETILSAEASWVVHETDTGVLPTTGWAYGDVILFRFFRDATAGADTYIGDAWIFTYHLDYLRDKLGEIST